MATAAVLTAAPARAGGFGPRVAGGATTVDRLWLWNTAGALASVGPGPTLALRFERGVVEAATTPDGALLVLRRIGPADAPLVITRLRGDAAQDGPPLRLAPGERPLALLTTAGGAYVLSTTSLHQLTTDGWRSRPLDDRRPPDRKGFARLVHADVGARVVLGWSRGEWGGGLDRLDLREARLTEIARTGPVTGLVADPSRPGCLQASLGVSHMLVSGEVDRLCGDTLSVVFSTSVQRPPDDILAGAKETEPQFGLARVGGVVWAITPRGLRRTDRPDPLTPLPPPTEVEGTRLSFGAPGLVVVWTDANGAMSLSGATPMVFAAPGQGSPPD